MDIVITIFSLIVLLFSVIIHELAHGYVANSLGDPTAKYQGRLTLNPLKHLDPFGSVILPLLLFISTGGAFVIGWAKPVPINPYNFTDKKWGTLKVSLAGPATNIVLALVFGLAIRFLPVSFFDLAPHMIDFFAIIVSMNILLAVFNLVPIPPLDGHWILFKFIPPQFENVKVFLQRYGIFILLLFILVAGDWLTAITGSIFHIITGV